jgi:hypothetical protein
MARLIKCPRCQSQMDVTSAQGGATVRCTDCGANVRIPTGSTGVYPKAQAPVAAAAPAAAGRRESTKVRAVGGGRQTDLFRKMSGARTPGGTKAPSRAGMDAEERMSGGGRPVRRSGGNQTMIGVACGVGILLLIGALAFGMMAKSESLKSDKENKAEMARRERARIDKQNAENRKLEAEWQAQADAEAKAAKDAEKSGKKSSLTKNAAGGYTAPATFEPGAKKNAKVDPPPVDAGLLREFDSMMASGRLGDAVNDPGKWMPCVLHGMLSDDEKVARGSFQVMNDLCVKFKVTTDSGKSPVDMSLTNSAYARGNNATGWIEWWEKPQNRAAFGVKAAVEELKTMGGGAGENPSKANWDDLMKDLRAGGAFDAMDRPEGKAFARVKAMGPGAYEYLAKYVDNEDPLLGRAAVTVLNTLTGRSAPMPTEGNRAAQRSEWEAYAKKAVADGK